MSFVPKGPSPCGCSPPAHVPSWLERPRAGLLRAAPIVCALFLVAQIAIALPDVLGDLAGERSSVAALGKLLDTTPDLASAIVIPEPDVYVEALPYYAKNEIFLPRERTFLRTKVNFTTANDQRLSLAALMAYADDLSQRRPVVIVVAHRLDAAGPFVIPWGYGKQLDYDAASLARFREHTTLVASLRASSGSENFEVYRWR